MKKHTLFSLVTIASLAVLVASFSVAAAAQSQKVEGIIKGRSGNTMSLATSDGSKMVVVLTDSTDVAQVQGAFKARNKKMSMAALIPGLPVQVEGSMND